MSMKSEIGNLLGDLCIELGFCLPPKEVDTILEKNHFTAEEFTKSVLIAEGMNPEMEIKHFRSIKRKFTDLFGNEISKNDY